jgi:ATP-dependent Clp protease ATP-binding subunit ClpC
MAEFNFDIATTAVFRSFKVWSFPLFRFSKVLSQVFLYLLVLSLFLVVFSFLGIVPLQAAVKVSVLMAVLLLVFGEIYFFTELKIKKPIIHVSLSEALKDPQTYNMAEFLTVPAVAIVESAMRKSKKKKLLGISSELLFYFALVQSRELQMMVFRLGLDIKKLQQELKNYVEKQARSQQFNVSLSDSFKATMQEAAKISNDRGYGAIGEKELFVALAHHDEFLEKVLVEHDLKATDIENITLWLDSLEYRIEQSKKFWTKENLARFGSLGKDWASGFTVTLDQFSIDWSRVMNKTIFNEIIGHKKEIDEVEMVLAKSDLSNALVVGDAGVGRKSIVEALAQRCYLGTGLRELHGKRVIELQMNALLAQVQDPEKLETMLDQIFQEVLAAGNVILVIDDLDNFMAQKVPKPGATDISGILATYLRLPNFHFVGITSFDGLHRRIEQDPSFLEYFRKVEVLEVSELETIMILQNLALALEQKYHVLITYPAIREIINLTGRYFPSTPFPKKAIDVLHEAVIYVSALKDLSLGKRHIKLVLPSHIAKIISEKTQIPLGKMEFKEKSVLLHLEELIHQRIVGQDEAVTEIAISMRRARSGISSKKRPMGVFLFLGPTGVGKTETAKALAGIYFGGEDKMIRLDMSEFQAITDIPRLIGSVTPVEQLGLLTTPVRENPFSLVLLDEIEKAHPNILNLFLQVFDEGHITDGQGRKIIFTNTIIICTSNAGSDIIFKEIEAGNTVAKSQIFDVLFKSGIFKPEFVNRFDAAVFFHPLTRENLLDIAQLSLTSLQKNLKEKDINFVITNDLKEKIVQLSYKPEFGAREMRRVIQDKVENQVAQALLSDTIIKGDKIEINPEDFSVVKNPPK